jgi:FkbM family methyltransferase
MARVEKQTNMPEIAQGRRCLSAIPDRPTGIVWKVKGWLAQFRLILRIFRNWPELVLFRLRLRNQVTAEWRSGGSVDIHSLQDWHHLQRGCLWSMELLKAYCGPVRVMDDKIELTFRGQALRFYSESVAISFGMLVEQFVQEQYKWLRVRGKQVLDVGANIGDSAIYFALNEAAHVYALEPYPYTYLQARKNVELNSLGTRVTVLNMGCGRESMIMVDPELKSEPSSNLVQHEMGERVPVVSLKRIVERYGLSNAVAKIDCEGCEYPLILGAGDEELLAFERIIIEYHHGHEGLVDRLKKAGFEVTHTRPVDFHNVVTGKSEVVGFIRAIKPW